MASNSAAAVGARFFVSPWDASKRIVVPPATASRTSSGAAAGARIALERAVEGQGQQTLGTFEMPSHETSPVAFVAWLPLWFGSNSVLLATREASSGLHIVNFKPSPVALAAPKRGPAAAPQPSYDVESVSIPVARATSSTQVLAVAVCPTCRIDGLRVAIALSDGSLRIVNVTTKTAECEVSLAIASGIDLTATALAWSAPLQAPVAVDSAVVWCGTSTGHVLAVSLQFASRQLALLREVAGSQRPSLAGAGPASRGVSLLATPFSGLLQSTWSAVAISDGRQIAIFAVTAAAATSPGPSDAAVVSSSSAGTPPRSSGLRYASMGAVSETKDPITSIAFDSFGSSLVINGVGSRPIDVAGSSLATPPRLWGLVKKKASLVEPPQDDDDDAAAQ